MTYKEQVDLYLSGLAGREAEAETEDAMLRDIGLFRQFIETSEQLASDAPSGFSSSVMRGIKRQTKPDTAVAVPVLNKKMCAAVCFCSAAAVIVFAVSGFDRQLSDFIINYSGKLNEILSVIKFL